VSDRWKRAVSGALTVRIANKCRDLDGRDVHRNEFRRTVQRGTLPIRCDNSGCRGDFGAASVPEQLLVGGTARKLAREGSYATRWHAELVDLASREFHIRVLGLGRKCKTQNQFGG
jgi:hypothetical protein